MAGEPNYYSRRKVFRGLEVDQAIGDLLRETGAIPPEADNTP
jgi:hypothetical protein